MDRPADIATDHAGVVLPPPLIYVAFFLVGLVLGRYVPLPRLPLVMERRTLAAVLLFSWVILTIWSFRRFWVSGTSIVPVRPATTLVIEGPYRFTRNPMYLGLLLLYTGAACWFGLVWPLLLAPALVVVMDVSVIGHEERYLTRKFGDQYRRYQTDVRRWL